MSAIIGTCECCAYEGIEVRPFTSLREYEIRNGLPESTQMFCVICSHTLISSSIHGFPTQNAPGVVNLAVSIAWIGNHIMQAVKEREQKS